MLEKIFIIIEKDKKGEIKSVHTHMRGVEEQEAALVLLDVAGELMKKAEKQEAPPIWTNEGEL